MCVQTALAALQREIAKAKLIGDGVDPRTMKPFQPLPLPPCPDTDENGVVWIDDSPPVKRRHRDASPQ